MIYATDNIKKPQQQPQQKQPLLQISIKINIMSPYENINNTLIYRYQKCKFCGNKTELTCIKCYFCYSCHKKQKTVNNHLIKHKFKEFSSSLLSSSSSSLSTTSRNESMHNQIQQLQPKLLVDVFGQKNEPICSYYRCRHKFSVHGLSKHGCRCKHPMNKTLGVAIRYNEEE